MAKFENDNLPYRVGLLLIDGFALMSYASVVESFRAANLLAGHEIYNVRNLAVYGSQAFSSSGAVINSTAQIGEQIDFDLVIVVAGGDPTAFKDKRVFQWLWHLSRRGVTLGGVSGGPVILAAAGLMEGRRMTMHWEHAPALAEISPSLLVEKTLYVIDGDRMTCAGGTAPLDMMHAMFTEHQNIDFANKVADWFMHTVVRGSSDPQRAGFVERYGTTSAPIIRAIEVMENHMAEPLQLAELASQSSVGTRQLNRLFSEKLGCGTMAFYRDLRLDKAKILLSQSPLSITEIALATGFCSSAHFAKSFRSKFGSPPSNFRR